MREDDADDILITLHLEHSLQYGSGRVERGDHSQAHSIDITDREVSNVGFKPFFVVLSVLGTSRLRCGFGIDSGLKDSREVSS